MAAKPTNSDKPQFFAFPEDFPPDDASDFEPVNVPQRGGVKVRDEGGAAVDPDSLKLQQSGSRLGKALGGLLLAGITSALRPADPPTTDPVDRIPDKFLTVRYVSADGELMWVNFLQGAEAVAARDAVRANSSLIYLDTVRTNTLPRSPTWQFEYEDPQAWPLAHPELRRMLPNYNPAAAAIRVELTSMFGVTARSAALLTSVIQEH